MANSTPNFKVLKDEHLSDHADDRFDHKSIAETLLDLIHKVEPPFTIGLYGQWGLGKSSICGFVKKSLEKEQDYEVFYFDTWKYQRDSFRRQFLIELDHDVFNETLNYKERLNQSLTIPENLTLRELLSKTFIESVKAAGVKLIIAALFAVAVLGIILAVAVGIGNIVFRDLPGTFSQTVAAFYAIGALALISKLIVESLKTYKSEATIPRTDSAEGFEYYYEEALAKLGNKKLVAIIDNLDRLEHEEGVELLSDIKTFLANEKRKEVKNKTIFVVPCDDAALTHQIKSVYKENIDAEEFLRKFFNISIRIPRLVDLSLDSYISSKLKETEIEDLQDNPSVSFVMSRALQNNPREVIQFINTFTGSYLLAHRRNLGTIIHKDNLPFFTKILAIRSKWPEIYRQIEDRVLRSAESFEDASKAVKVPSPAAPYFPEYLEFIATTDTIRDQEEAGVQAYFSLYQSQESSTLSEWTAFILAAEGRRAVDLQDVYESIEDSAEKKSSLKSLLLSYYNQNQSRKDKLLNVFRSIHDILDEESRPVFETFLSRAYPVFETESLLPHIEDLGHEKILTFDFPSLAPETKRNISKVLIAVFDLLARQSSINLKQFRRVVDFFELTSGEKLRDFFKQYDSKLAEVKQLTLERINIPEMVPESSPDWFLPGLLSFITETYPYDAKVYSPGIHQLFMVSQYGLFTTKMEETLTAILVFLEKNPRPHQLNDETLTRLSELSNHVVSQYHVASTWDPIRNLGVKIAVLLYFKENPQLGIITNTISDFVSNLSNSTENIQKTLSKEEIKSLLSTIPEVKNSIVSRSTQDPDLLVALGLGQELDNAQIQGICSGLTSSNPEGLLRLLTNIKFVLPDPVKEEQVKLMVERLPSLPEELLVGWLEAMKKIAVPDSYIPRYFELISVVRGRSDPSKATIKKFISKNKKIFSDDQTKSLLAD